MTSVSDSLQTIADSINPKELLKFSIVNSTNGIATGDFLYALNSNILLIGDTPIGSVDCVALGLLAPDKTGLAGNRFIGTAAGVANICGLENFIQVTTKSGMNLYVRKSGVMCIYDAALCNSAGTPPATMLECYVEAENVIESISAIVSAMNFPVIAVV